MTTQGNTPPPPLGDPLGRAEGAPPPCPNASAAEAPAGADHVINFDGSDVTGPLAAVCVLLPVVVIVLLSVCVYLVVSRWRGGESGGRDCVNAALLLHRGEDDVEGAGQGGGGPTCGYLDSGGGGGGGYGVIPGGVFLQSRYGNTVPCDFNRPETRVTYVTVRTKSVESYDSGSPAGDEGLPVGEEPPRNFRKFPDRPDRRQGLLKERVGTPDSIPGGKGTRSYGGVSESGAVSGKRPDSTGERGGQNNSSLASEGGQNGTGSYPRDSGFPGLFRGWTLLAPKKARRDSKDVEEIGPGSRQPETGPENPGNYEQRGRSSESVRDPILPLPRQPGIMGTAHSAGQKPIRPERPWPGELSQLTPQKHQQQRDSVPEVTGPARPRKASVQFDSTGPKRDSSLATDPLLQNRRKSECAPGPGSGFASVFGRGGGGGVRASESGSEGNSSRTVSGIGDQEGSEDQFWVPSAILQKKRAQSLIPQTLDTKHGSYLSKSSLSPSDSIHELLSIPLSAERLTESSALVQMPCAGAGAGAVAGGPQYHRRRRASMQDALDHTKIDASLYETPVAHPGDRSVDDEDSLGALNFAVSYDPDQSLLTVRLIQARDLQPRDFSGTADPFCRLRVLGPGGPRSSASAAANQLQTRVHKKTLCPAFDEEFIFEVSGSDLEAATLEVLVFDYDQFSHDECVGQIRFPLDQLNHHETVDYWKGFSTYKKKTQDECNGDLMFSMAYLGSAERLTIAVIKARKLRMLNEGMTSPNPFVRVSILVDGKKRKRKKTSTKRGTTSPVWNEALVFNIDKDLLDTMRIEIAVFNDNLLGNNDLLGEVTVGKDTSGEELAHWNDLLHLKNALARWHSIQ